MRLQLIPAALLLFTFAACETGNSNVATDSYTAEKIAQAELEGLSNTSFDGETITTVAMSNGCTKPDHFRIESTVINNQCVIAVVRAKEDHCRAMPTPLNVKISWSVPVVCRDLLLQVRNPLLELPANTRGRTLR